MAQSMALEPIQLGSGQLDTCEISDDLKGSPAKPMITIPLVCQTLVGRSSIALHLTPLKRPVSLTGNCRPWQFTPALQLWGTVWRTPSEVSPLRVWLQRRVTVELERPGHVRRKSLNGIALATPHVQSTFTPTHVVPFVRSNYFQVTCISTSRFQRVQLASSEALNQRCSEAAYHAPEVRAGLYELEEKFEAFLAPKQCHGIYA